MKTTDTKILKGIKNKDPKTFETVFRSLYPGLCMYASKLVKQKDVSEDIVQDTFIKLWNNAHKIEIHTSLKSYLFKAVHNASINYIKHKKTIGNYKDAYQKTIDFAIEEYQNEPGFEDAFNLALNELPKRCREIFVLSRIDGLRHKQIAKNLSITEKTVEVQIRKASIILREKLKEFAPILFLFSSIQFFLW